MPAAAVLPAERRAAQRGAGVCVQLVLSRGPGAERDADDVAAHPPFVATQRFLTRKLPAWKPQELTLEGFVSITCVCEWECLVAVCKHACPGACGEGLEASWCVTRSPGPPGVQTPAQEGPAGRGRLAWDLSWRNSSRWRWGAEVFVFSFLLGSGVWSCSPWKQEFELDAPSGPGAGGQPCLPVGTGRGGSARPQPVWDRL